MRIAILAGVPLLMCAAAAALPPAPARAADGDPIVVTVLGADGRPVRGAAVRLDTGITCGRGMSIPETMRTTGADGVADFPGFAGFRIRAAFAEEPEGRVACVVSQEKEGLRGRVELRLRPAARVRGHVVAPDGTQVAADATLHWFST